MSNTGTFLFFLSELIWGRSPWASAHKMHAKSYLDGSFEKRRENHPSHFSPSPFLSIALVPPWSKVDADSHCDRNALF